MKRHKWNELISNENEWKFELDDKLEDMSEETDGILCRYTSVLNKFRL
jgi:hypothetical protein